MIKPPRAAGLVLCHGLRFQPTPPRLDLEGVLNHLRVASLPWWMPPLVAYAVLFDGRGEGEMALRCTHLEAEEDIFYHGRWMAFTPGDLVHFEMRLNQLRLHRPGRHVLSLVFDNQPVTELYLDVEVTGRGSDS